MNTTWGMKKNTIYWFLAKFDKCSAYFLHEVSGRQIGSLYFQRKTFNLFPFSPWNSSLVNITYICLFWAGCFSIAVSSGTGVVWQRQDCYFAVAGWRATARIINNACAMISAREIITSGCRSSRSRGGFLKSLMSPLLCQRRRGCQKGPYAYRRRTLKYSPFVYFVD